MSRPPTRSFILHRLKNCSEAHEGLRQWHEGEFTFEQAMMETVNRLLLAKEAAERQD